MNISDEKQHLYSLMRDVTEERRRLTEIYYDLKSRLEDLHKLEMRGLEDLSVKGYVDLLNETSKDIMVKNIERESQKIIREIEKTKSNIVEEESIIPKHEIAESIARDNRNKVNVKEKKQKRKMIDFERVMNILMDICKEEGKPVSSKVLHVKLNERLDEDEKINKSNFTGNILYRGVKQYPKFQRAMHGYYQYNPNG